MKRKALVVGLFLLAPVVISWGIGTASMSEKLTAEDVVLRHLESIGTLQARAARRSFQAKGTSYFGVVTGGIGLLHGPATFLTEGNRLRMSMRFDMNEYPAEEVAFDGKSLETSYTQPGVRSKLCQYLYDMDEIVSEGLFGGALSGGWSLLDLGVRKPTLKYEGLKTVDGREFHTLRYLRRQGSDAEVRLYFDTETFRHAHTIYRVLIQAPIVASSPNQSANQVETRYTLKESFANFLKLANLTLPSRWTIEFTTEIGTTGSVLRWANQYTTFNTNIAIEPGLFSLGLSSPQLP